jgi:CRP-like cAMP-binding protein
VPAGEVLCREGETGQEFFVIVEGKTDVTSKGKRVATLGDGDFVGEIALLEDTKRTATVAAKTPLRLFVLTRQDFRLLVNENRSVERKVMQAPPAGWWSSRRTRRWLRRRGRDSNPQRTESPGTVFETVCGPCSSPG